ncbi:MAG: hypothetical protein ACYDAN_16010 [Candidatus Limnocylindrales bacterium]
MGRLVDVPENAVREEPLAFGLTVAQLLVCGAAVAIGALLDLLPLWLPVRAVLVLLAAGPVLAAAVLPVRGEPAYRWVIRAARYWRGPRVLDVSGAEAGRKGEISGVRHDAPVDDAPGGVVDTGGDGHSTGEPVPTREAERDGPVPPPSVAPARLRVVEPAADDAQTAAGDTPPQAASDRPDLVPRALPTMRVVAVAGFAGGTGRTTLAAEVATLVAASARIRVPDGSERAVRVLLLDAARLASAAGLRLGLPPAAIAASRGHRLWRDPSAVAEAAARTPWGADVLTLPPHPQLSERDAAWGEAAVGSFGAAEAGELVEGAQRAGYHLLVADLGSLLEDGHRELIDEADLVLGVVRPALESLPDVFRLATALRAQGMGRKLALVASAADDDAEIRRLAREADVPLAGCVRPDPAFTEAADRGVPAWSLAPELADDLLPIARASWPLLGDAAARPAGRRSRLRSVRAALSAPGGAR